MMWPPSSCITARRPISGSTGPLNNVPGLLCCVFGMDCANKEPDRIRLQARLVNRARIGEPLSLKERKKIIGRK